jgi:hypothetical protein
MYARCDWVDIDWHNNRCSQQATAILVAGCIEAHTHDIVLCLTHTNAWESAAHNDSVYCENINCENTIIGWEKANIGKAAKWLKHHHT